MRLEDEQSRKEFMAKVSLVVVLVKFAHAGTILHVMHLVLPQGFAPIAVDEGLHCKENSMRSLTCSSSMV
jgi:hypothetical protein